MSLPHYDTRISPICTLVVMGATAFLAANADVQSYATLAISDLRALRAALNRWEDEMLAQQVDR